MVGISTQKNTHGLRGQLRLPRQQGIRIRTIEPSSRVEEDHLLGLTLGVQVGHDFEGRVSLHEGHLHVERPEVHAQDCLGDDAAGEEEREG